jgi:hypothetical protein
MIIAIPSHEDLCLAPELAILTALEAALALAIPILTITHTEIPAPGDPRYPPSPDAYVAADIIAAAAHTIAAINRYRLALAADDGRTTPT